MEVTYSQDKWVISEARLTGVDRWTRVHWCYNQWGGGWGTCTITNDFKTEFIFYRKSHAEWFKLRWA